MKEKPLCIVFFYPLWKLPKKYQRATNSRPSKKERAAQPRALTHAPQAALTPDDCVGWRLRAWSRSCQPASDDRYFSILSISSLMKFSFPSASAISRRDAFVPLLLFQYFFGLRVSSSSESLSFPTCRYTAQSLAIFSCICNRLDSFSPPSVVYQYVCTQ